MEDKGVYDAIGGPVKFDFTRLGSAATNNTPAARDYMSYNQGIAQLEETAATKKWQSTQRLAIGLVAGGASIMSGVRSWTDGWVKGVVLVGAGTLFIAHGFRN